jgi:hypothetical protein
VDAGRAEQDHRVLDPLGSEALERLEVLGHDPERAALVALEELRVQISQRLGVHSLIIGGRTYGMILGCPRSKRGSEVQRMT